MRLYHTHPDKVEIGTTGYYAYYIPGVGTPFPEIGDNGGMLGSGMALGGEARIIWGLTRVFNAASQYSTKSNLISNQDAEIIARNADRLPLKTYWQSKLKRLLEGRKPQITQINLSVFGFSRGAAEARVFVNWLYELCKPKDGGWQFAGIPLRIQFLGIFDTVSSIGFAGLYSILEGRQSWAWNNMQIHPGVEQCLHLVAAHEVRACFPMDSARVDGQYPANVKEYVYPGSHSDVGGGYIPLALGKNDWQNSDDRQLARIPGYEMYCAALAAGVPLIPIIKLIEPVAKALQPHADTIKAFQSYYAAAKITPGPVEYMHRQHMSHYFSHRWQWLEKGWQTSPEKSRVLLHLNKGEQYKNEYEWMQKTQRAFIMAIACLMEEIDRRMSSSPGFWSDNERLEQPLALNGVSSSGRMTKWRAITYKEGQPPALIPAGNFPNFLQNGDRNIQNQAAEMARNAPEYLRKWRKWLADNNQAEVHDTAIEREPLLLLESLQVDPVPTVVSDFFMNLVHDSMAGFMGMGMGMDEFWLNGFGIAKLRRIYTGDNGDDYLCNIVKKTNEERIASAKAKRAQKAKWTAESNEYRRTIPR